MKLNNIVVLSLIASCISLLPATAASTSDRQADGAEAKAAFHGHVGGGREAGGREDGRNGQKAGFGGGDCGPGGCTGDGRHGGRGHGAMRMSDDQLEKLNSLRLAFQSSIAVQKAELGVQQNVLRDLLTKPEIDRAQATSIQGKIDALRTQIADARLNFMMDASSVLTLEQKQMKRHFMLMHGFSHHRHHGGGKSEG